MIAPHFKKLAEEYKDRAVFAKVDVNYNHQVASEQMIRSMPTFQFYLFGKKRDQFSGADINRIQGKMQELTRESKLKNVEVTLDAFKAFYAEVAPEKVEDAKLQQLLERNGKNGGPGHYALVEALKKKYDGKAPKTRPRVVAEAAAGEKPAAGGKAGAQPDCKAVATEPSLHLASIDQLQAELERRREAEEERRFEAATDEDEHTHTFPVYNASTAPEVEQLAIIGGGPAGLAAAIYAARAGLRPVVIAPPVGGQLQGKGVLVENYPGINGTTGPDIVFDMQKQAAEFGAYFEQDLVVSIDLKSSPMTIKVRARVCACERPRDSATARVRAYAARRVRVLEGSRRTRSGHMLTAARAHASQ
jgi:thiol-disulfide isomerase/thioredoxin